MIVTPEPREHPSQTIVVVSAAGSKVLGFSGYLDGVIFDAPGSETFKLSIKGPSGKEYYLSASNLTGDATVLFSTPIPMTGAMTFGITGASGDGSWGMVLIGNMKKV